MPTQRRIAKLRRATTVPSTMINVKVPTHITGAVDQLARRLGVSKTEVVVALLTQGLGTATKRLGKQLRK